MVLHGMVICLAVLFCVALWRNIVFCVAMRHGDVLCCAAMWQGSVL